MVPFKPSRKHTRLGNEPEWPDYELCLRKAPRAREGGPDRSRADFFWCMMAARRGWSVEDIASKLLEVSEKAQEKARLHDEGYAHVTAQSAAAAAERGRKRGERSQRVESNEGFSALRGWSILLAPRKVL